MSRKFWMVWCRDGGPPTVMHRTARDAEREAERLSRACHGRTFTVLEAVRSVRFSDVLWEEAVDVSDEPL